MKTRHIFVSFYLMHLRKAWYCSHRSWFRMPHLSGIVYRIDLGQCFTTRKVLSTRDICWLGKGGWSATNIQWVKPKDAVNHPTVHRTNTTQELSRIIQTKSFRVWKTPKLVEGFLGQINCGNRLYSHIHFLYFLLILCIKNTFWEPFYHYFSVI
jgi:hypothetical protein